MSEEVRKFLKAEKVVKVSDVRKRMKESNYFDVNYIDVRIFLPHGSAYQSIIPTEGVWGGIRFTFYGDLITFSPRRYEVENKHVNDNYSFSVTTKEIAKNDLWVLDASIEACGVSIIHDNANAIGMLNGIELFQDLSGVRIPRNPEERFFEENKGGA